MPRRFDNVRCSGWTGSGRLGTVRTGETLALAAEWLYADETDLGAFFRGSASGLGVSILTDLKQTIAELELRLQASLTERDELMQQQAATNEVLQVINASSGDLAPVFEAILERAMRLCEAEFGLLATYDGGQIRTVAARGVPQAFAEFRKNNPPDYGPGTGPARILAGERVVHIVDLESGDAYRAGDPNRRAVVDLGGARSVLLVPLLKNESVLGYIIVYRKEVRPYSDKQIVVLQNFADQAVIAIENARMFEEVQARTCDLTEALTYQTGSSKILSVIASSPTDVGPALNAIVESACELCDAYDAVVVLKDGDYLRFSAHHGPIPLKFEKLPINRNWVTGRAVFDKVPIHIHDLLSPEGDQFPLTRERLQQEGHRTVLSVPMLREVESIGAIVLRRLEVHPFSEKQVTLLQTFANQAVIAIGNVRLFEEVQARTRDLSESLEQQTATSEVLEVISSSTGDVDPIFQKLLENATRVCGADFGNMNLVEGGMVRQVALYNAPAAFASAQTNKFFRPHPESGLGTVLRTKHVVHMEDLRTRATYLERDPAVVAMVDLAGARTSLVVPMRRDEELIGAIVIYRQEVCPFSDKQIDLLKNFAKQAVIAIENARLLRELCQRTADLSESLQQQFLPLAGLAWRCSDISPRQTSQLSEIGFSFA
jgi:two-component system NtrC family sensor kinase